MSGPGGREVERISVKVVPDTDGFRAEVKREIERAERDKVEIKVELKDNRVKEQLKRLGRDLKVKIRTELEKSDLKKMSKSLAQFGKAQSLDIQGELGSKTQKKIRTQIREVVSGNSFTVQGFLSSSSMKQINKQLAEFGKKTEVKFTAKMDTWAARRQLDKEFSAHHTKIQVDLEDAAARAELRLLTLPRHINVGVRINKSQFTSTMRLIGRGIAAVAETGRKIFTEFAIGWIKTFVKVGEIIGGTVKRVGGFLQKLGPIMEGVQAIAIGVLIPALIGVIEVAFAVAGALALAFTPAIFIGFGVAFAAMLNDAKGEIKKFQDNLDGLKKTAKSVMTDAVTPMIREINANVLPGLNKFVESLRGPLKKAFTEASRYVEPLVSGLKNFTTQLLDGLIAALESPGTKLAMEGFSDLLSDIGLALGSFFKQLSTHGPEFKETLRALGDALILMAPAFADLLGAFATISPDILKQLADGLTKVFHVLSDPAIQETIKLLTGISFAVIFGTLVQILLVINDIRVAWSGLVTAFNTAIQWIRDRWNEFKEWFKQTWENIKTAVGNAAAQMVQDVIFKLTGLRVPIDTIKQWFRTAWENIKTTARNAWNLVVSFAKSKLNELKTGALAVVEAIKGFFRGMADTINGIISGIKTGLQGLKDAANAAKRTIGSIALPGIIGLEMPDIEQGVKFTPRNSPAGFGEFGSFDDATASWRRDTRRMRLQQLRAVVPNVGSGNTYSAGDIYPTTEVTPQALINSWKRLEAIHGT